MAQNKPKQLKTPAGSASKKADKKTQAGYDAAETRKRRRTSTVDTRGEDKVLKSQDRDRVISDSRNLRRNAAIVAWAIRKHQDYVSTFSFRCRCSAGAPPELREMLAQLDDQIEGLVRWWARPLNCDASGRFSLEEQCRLWEGLRTTDGDCFIVKLQDGTLQTIEGDRVRTPNNVGNFTELDPKGFVHGIEIKGGRPSRYALCEHAEVGGYVLKYLVPESQIYHHGYFERPLTEQVRGISPLASAINSFCDIYEATEYALAKMKLSQIFALKLNVSGEADDPEDGQPFTFDFGSGPQSITLPAGDDASFLESKNPSSEFQSFMQTGIQIGLKSLDIPYSFFSENYTNYSGARQALLMYEQSAATKRKRNKQLLTNLTLWRLQMFIADGELVLPDGMKLSDIQFEWVHAGIPWIDPLKEAQADSARVAGNTASRQQLSRERGQDWFDTADELAEELLYLKAKGLAIEAPSAPSPVTDPQEIADAVSEQIKTA